MYKIYRIEHPTDKDGMWYNIKGEPKKQIHKLCPNGVAKDFPMPFNELHKKDGLNWCSAGGSVEQMNHWFSAEDAKNLLDNGYKLYELRVSEIQDLEKEVLFCREHIISTKEIELTEVWNIN